MARLAAVALVLLAAWAVAAMPAHAQGATFSVEGRVENGTSGGAAAGVEVVLHTVRSTVRTDEPTLTDEEGAFRFDDVPLDPAAAYGVSVVYQGALYGMDLDTSAGAPEPVTLTIYESTHDDGAVRAILASVLFASADREEQTVAALEIIRIVNESNQTYVPGPEPMNLLRFGLPPDARNLEVDSTLPDADFAQVDRGFALLASVPPGEHEVLYSYSFPYSGGSAEFTKSLLYGAEHLRVLAPEGELSLSSGDAGRGRLRGAGRASLPPHRGLGPAARGPRIGAARGPAGAERAGVCDAMDRVGAAGGERHRRSRRGDGRRVRRRGVASTPCRAAGSGRG